MYFVRTPHITSFLYPSLTWSIPGKDKKIYLTFDDGPDPDVTPDVLKLLQSYRAKATFFCVGEKTKQHPGLYRDVLQAGHSTGNHTYNHLNGKTTSLEEYVRNTAKAAELINSNLFRPPYGKFRYRQIRALSRDYQVVMWTVLPGDFDEKASKEKVLNRVLKHTRSGSIVVLHDNARFREKMLFTLEGMLQHFSKKDYCFAAIPQRINNQQNNS